MGHSRSGGERGGLRQVEELGDGGSCGRVENGAELEAGREGKARTEDERAAFHGVSAEQRRHIALAGVDGENRLPAIGGLGGDGRHPADTENAVIHVDRRRLSALVSALSRAAKREEK